ncbi:hypothetical protein HYW11_03070 [Candidatus Peregrinibacteria bacterium]|nr:hypothetical protein [Candidatus Peregrinibacteria bacterium]
MSEPISHTLLERTIGVHFRNKELLLQALTHRSAVRESRMHGHNERMEFLGDAVSRAGDRRSSSERTSQQLHAR